MCRGLPKHSTRPPWGCLIREVGRLLPPSVLRCWGGEGIPDEPPLLELGRVSALRAGERQALALHQCTRWRNASSDFAPARGNPRQYDTVAFAAMRSAGDYEERPMPSGEGPAPPTSKDDKGSGTRRCCRQGCHRASEPRLYQRYQSRNRRLRGQAEILSRSWQTACSSGPISSGSPSCM